VPGGRLEDEIGVGRPDSRALLRHDRQALDVANWISPGERMVASAEKKRRIGTENYNILHHIKMGSDWPVMATIEIRALASIAGASHDIRDSYTEFAHSGSLGG